MTAPHLALTLGGRIPVGVLLVVGVVLAGGYAIHHYLRQRRKREDLERLVARDPRLERTVIPCGLRPDQLAWWCRTLPRGDRNFGTQFGVEGPMVVDLGADLPREATVAAFRWWYEQRSRHRNRRTGTRTTSYTKQHLPAALVELPVHLDTRIEVRPTSVLGRVGLTRGGQQLESNEFNRRFHVEARDPELALHLLDANLQQLLVEHFQGRTIELFGPLLLVAGEPSHRDDTLTGVIGQLPAMRQDAHRILHAIPSAFWRQVVGRPDGPDVTAGGAGAADPTMDPGFTGGLGSAGSSRPDRERRWRW